jgi:purine-binding chemotaxis protein CheW
MDATSRPQRTLDVLELVLAGAHYGLPLDRVVEVVPRVTITRLPELAPPVLGFLVHRGAAVAAVDMRHRLGYPARPPSLADHVIIARARTRLGTGTRMLVALVVDRALGVRQVDLARLQLPPESASFVAGVTPLGSGLLLVSDLDAVLSLEQERAVAAALRALEEQA